MDYPQIRRAALEALRRQSSTEWRNFLHSFGIVAHELGFVEIPGGLSPTDGCFGQRVYASTTAQDKERLREVFWALVVEGVIILGINDNNPEWPFFRVTEYGMKVLEAGEVIPHDPDGYLERVHADCAPFDPVAEVYLAESLQCFLRGTYMASAVMLGVASERLFLNLLEAFTESLAPSSAQKLRQATSNRPLGRQWKEFRKRLDPQRSDLPDELQDDLNTILDGVFSLIRATRNEAGHPTGRRIDREIMYAHLQLFRSYARRVVALTEYFKRRGQPKSPQPPPRP